jgi:hypothetical protein
MQEPPHGYSIDELHAYAKANDYRDEADTLRYYLKLRQRRERGGSFRMAADAARALTAQAARLPDG